jgi:hypothetical protein
MKAPTVATLYPRHGGFVSAQERLAPRDAFRNEWLQSRVLGTWAGVGRHPAQRRPSRPGHGAYTGLARTR